MSPALPFTNVTGVGRWVGAEPRRSAREWSLPNVRVGHFAAAVANGYFDLESRLTTHPNGGDEIN
jgi:hypothetical protein